MSTKMWIRSHVEQLLECEWDACRIESDSDGDYPFRCGTGAGWVSVLDSQPVMVRVFAHAAFGVKPTAAVLRELNDIQRRLLSARIEIADGIVVVSQTISPIELTQPVLSQAIGQVSSVASDVGPMVVAVFGGGTPYPSEQPQDEEAA